jgi:adenylate kinase family enzyme
MLHTVIFIGRSGCGKGTQAALLKDRIHTKDKEKRHILYVETGEKFRQFVRGKSFSATRSNKVYESGERQPNFLGAYMWSEMLIEELEDNMHVIFDGVARSRPEAEMLTTALEFYGREKPTVVYINVSRKWSEDRLLARGRSDDKTLDKINKRLDWFERDAMPSLDYFKSNPFYRYLEVNGEQSIEQVFEDLISHYDKTEN